MTNVEVFDPSAWSALEIGLPVDEMEPMRRFYCDALGFTPAGHLDLPVAHIEAFRFGDCLLKLSFFLDEARRPKPHLPDPLALYMTLRVSALDDVVRHCQAMGVSLLVPPTTIQTKDAKTVRFAFVADPMGNRIELVEGNAWSA